MRAILPDPLKGFVECRIGKDQPQYETLPAICDPAGLVLTTWELTAEEFGQLAEGGVLLLWVHTGGGAFPPIALEVRPPAPAVTIRPDRQCVSDPDA